MNISKNKKNEKLKKISNTKRIVLVAVITLFCILNLSAKSSTYVDDKGLMRWTKTNKELCLFGTNYLTPFAYWDAKSPIKADYHKAIDEDVYHIGRLGLDGYRLHVFESYISDALGNLIYNEHFELFDYLLFKLKERGVKIVITPMYLSSGGSSFSSKYGGKESCLANPKAWPAQENYLKNLLNHINPYTGIAYKKDSDIIALEVVNEPGHWKNSTLVTEYINNMYDAIRATGCEKPILYNMSTCASKIDKVLKSKIQGGTFQWYPSGLTSNRNLMGNMLPNVDEYYIPFDEKIKKTNRTKFIYEFSPADIGASSHIYPAMARSFREAGFQFAAQFSYDPMFDAYCNIEYRTHFLNLAYTPKKSIGMLIASEVFHNMPLYKSYGRFPKNNKFGPFTLNYENDLTEMVTKTKYLYSNNTNTKPSAPQDLEQIAGTGSSPIVKYDGTGVYFLDKLEDGVWRLEVMPDVVWVRDPFFVPSVGRENSVILWKKHKMTINLPGLGKIYSITALDDGNDYRTNSYDKSFVITPGSYMLKRNGKETKWTRNDKFKNLRLKEFYAPIRKSQNSYVVHKSPSTIIVNSSLKIKATVVTSYNPDLVELVLLGIGKTNSIPMRKVDAYNYEVTIPADYTKKEKILQYYISIKNKDKYETFPSGVDDLEVKNRRIYSDDKKILDTAPYSISVVSKFNPICLFDAENDLMDIAKFNRNSELEIIPMKDIPGKVVLTANVKNLNKIKSGIKDFSFKIYCREKVVTRLENIEAMSKIEVFGNSLNGKPCKLQVALIMKNGIAYGNVIQLDTKTGLYTLNIRDLKRVKSVLLPHAYPAFQKYWFESASKDKFDIKKVESIQLSIGPGISVNKYDEQNGVAIGWILLQ